MCWVETLSLQSLKYFRVGENKHLFAQKGRKNCVSNQTVVTNKQLWWHWRNVADDRTRGNRVFVSTDYVVGCYPPCIHGPEIALKNIMLLDDEFGCLVRRTFVIFFFAEISSTLYGPRLFSVPSYYFHSENRWQTWLLAFSWRLRLYNVLWSGVETITSGFGSSCRDTAL